MNLGPVAEQVRPTGAVDAPIDPLKIFKFSVSSIELQFYSVNILGVAFIDPNLL